MTLLTFQKDLKIYLGHLASNSMDMESSKSFIARDIEWALLQVMFNVFNMIFASFGYFVASFCIFNFVHCLELWFRDGQLYKFAK